MGRLPDGKTGAGLPRLGASSATGVLFLLLVLWQVSASAQSPAPGRELSEQLIGPRVYKDARDPALSRFMFPAPEGRGIAYAYREGRRWRLIMEGAGPREYDGLEIRNHFVRGAVKAVPRWRGPTYSKDGKHHAFAVRRGRRWFMVKDGVELRGYRLVREPRMSADGKHLAYIARERGREYVVLDEKRGPAYRRIESLLLSPDGKHIAYVARKRRRRRVMVLDNQEDRLRVNPRKPVFSPVGGELAYVAGPRGKEFTVRGRIVGGRPNFRVGKTHRIVGRFTFSPDGKRTAYLAKDGDKRRYIVDGREMPAYDFCYHFSFSPDSRRFAYVAAGADAMFVVLDGKKQRAYKHVVLPLYGGRPRFFTPSGRWAYKAGEDDQEFVVTDKGRGKPYDSVDPTPWGPAYLNGVKTAFSARFDERAFVVVGDRESRKYDSVRGPLVTSGSKHIAFAAKRDGRFYLVRDGRELSNYDDVRYMSFGPAGRRVLALANKSGKEVLDVDGRPGPLYDRIIGQPRFTGADTVTYYAARNGNIYAVSEKIGYPPPADPRKPAPITDKKTPATDKKAPTGDKKAPAK